MRKTRLQLSTVLVAFLVLAFRGDLPAHATQSAHEFDIVIYGGTSADVMAAVQAQPQSLR